ncbi:MAG: hypothetical protein F4X12_01800 [Acidobacteriia bacterium]|nr:hypothetical protein [Terriglobia bacterium]
MRPRRHADDPDRDSCPTAATLPIVVRGTVKGVDSVPDFRAARARETPWHKARVYGAASPQLGRFR